MPNNESTGKLGNSFLSWRLYRVGLCRDVHPKNRSQGRENTTFDENDRTYYVLGFCKKSFEVDVIFKWMDFCFRVTTKGYSILFNHKKTLCLIKYRRFIF